MKSPGPYAETGKLWLAVDFLYPPPCPPPPTASPTYATSTPPSPSAEKSLWSQGPPPGRASTTACDARRYLARADGTPPDRRSLAPGSTTAIKLERFAVKKNTNQKIRGRAAPRRAGRTMRTERPDADDIT
jgi:hypothetical protein